VGAELQTGRECKRKEEIENKKQHARSGEARLEKRFWYMTTSETGRGRMAAHLGLKTRERRNVPACDGGRSAPRVALTKGPNEIVLPEAPEKRK